MSAPEFVRWREEWVSQERGSRIVHYYLEDAAGVSHIAVVGTERSVRHMFYVVTDGFRAALGLEGGEVRKWRSRREVVSWLASLLPEEARRNLSNYEIEPSGCTAVGNFHLKNIDKSCNSDITWCGAFWTCGKQLRHYQAFSRDGTTISAYSFVMVMSEEENRHFAYLEDMYEDRKGQKKVKVRWFHRNKEFSCMIPPPDPHPNEVFITPHSQVISVECVDDVATILTPEHYEAMLPCSTSELRFCYRQYSKNKFKHFDLRNLRGYFSQTALLSLGIEKENDASADMKMVNQGNGTTGQIRFTKQHQKVYDKCLGPPFQINVPSSVDWKIELLCQDSGIRGCWFKCTVLKICQNSVKVRYNDVQDANDCEGLEEWVPRYRMASPDKLGMRWPGRLTIRPCRNDEILSRGVPVLPGHAVDVWWNDGWWEGVVTSDQHTDDKLQVYFPGEDFCQICDRSNVRISRDWINNDWADIKPKSDILTLITSISKRVDRPFCLASAPGAESGSSAMSGREPDVTRANSNEISKQPEVSLCNGASPLMDHSALAVLVTPAGVEITKG